MKLYHYWKQFITVASVPELWTNQPTYLLVQALFILGGALTLIHGKSIIIYK